MFFKVTETNYKIPDGEMVFISLFHHISTFVGY